MLLLTFSYKKKEKEQKKTSSWVFCKSSKGKKSRSKEVVYMVLIFTMRTDLLLHTLHTKKTPVPHTNNKAPF